MQCINALTALMFVESTKGYNPSWERWLYLSVIIANWLLYGFMSICYCLCFYFHFSYAVFLNAAFKFTIEAKNNNMQLLLVCTISWSPTSCMHSIL